MGTRFKHRQKEEKPDPLLMMIMVMMETERKGGEQGRKRKGLTYLLTYLSLGAINPWMALIALVYDHRPCLLGGRSLRASSPLPPEEEERFDDQGGGESG